MPNTNNNFTGHAALIGKNVVAFYINAMAMTSSARGKIKNVGLNRSEKLCVEIVPKGKRKGSTVCLDSDTILLPEDCGIISDMEKGGAWHGNACMNLYHKGGIDRAREIIESENLNPNFKDSYKLFFVHDSENEFVNDDSNMEPFYPTEYTGHAVVDRYNEKWKANN